MKNKIGEFPLMMATKTNDIELLQLLSDYNANYNQVDNEGITCLIYSIFEGFNEISLFLISKSETDINKYDDVKKISPLMAATMKNSIDICTALSSRPDIDVSLKNAKGIILIFLSICIFIGCKV